MSCNDPLILGNFLFLDGSLNENKVGTASLVRHLLIPAGVAFVKKQFCSKCASHSFELWFGSHWSQWEFIGVLISQSFALSGSAGNLYILNCVLRLVHPYAEQPGMLRFFDSVGKIGRTSKTTFYNDQPRININIQLKTQIDKDNISLKVEIVSYHWNFFKNYQIVQKNLKLPLAFRIWS